MRKSSAEYHRQADIWMPTEDTQTATVVGAGGIGSNAAFTIARMGVGTVLGDSPDEGRLTVIDGDTVEAHNLPNQLYGEKDIGKPKVEALKSLVECQTGVEIEAVPEMWDGQRLSGLVISGLDSMAVRKELWEKTVRYNPKIPLYVDGRMGGEMALIYAVRPLDPEDVKLYEDELNTDEDAPDLPCTAKAIIYNTSMIGSLIANLVKKWSSHQPFPRELYFDFVTLSILPREVRV